MRKLSENAIIMVRGGAQDQPRKGVRALGRRANPSRTILCLRGDKMDLATITEFIQNVGFPITCCAVLFYLLYQGMQQRQEEAQERAKRDAEFSRIIAENTAATNSLKELVRSLHGENNA